MATFGVTPQFDMRQPKVGHPTGAPEHCHGHCSSELFHCWGYIGSPLVLLSDTQGYESAQLKCLGCQLVVRADA
jgi:hypothetical protein